MNTKSKSGQARWSMTHGGAYSLATQGAKDAIDNASDLALEALAKIDAGTGTVLAGG